jgi:hypothetical protein
MHPGQFVSCSLLCFGNFSEATRHKANSNGRYKRHKDSGHMACLTNLASQSCFEILLAGQVLGSETSFMCNLLSYSYRFKVFFSRGASGR